MPGESEIMFCNESRRIVQKMCWERGRKGEHRQASCFLTTMSSQTQSSQTPSKHPHPVKSTPLSPPAAPPPKWVKPGTPSPPVTSDPVLKPPKLRTMDPLTLPSWLFFASNGSSTGITSLPMSYWPRRVMLDALLGWISFPLSTCTWYSMPECYCLPYALWLREKRCFLLSLLRSLVGMGPSLGPFGWCQRNTTTVH
jgi:hypothetical protein